MPAINIYLPEELFEYVKQDKSKIIQQALKEYVARHTPPRPHNSEVPSSNIDTYQNIEKSG